MTKKELITLVREVKKNDGRVLVQYNSPQEAKTKVLLFTEITRTSDIPLGIQFGIGKGTSYFNVNIPFEIQDDIKYSLEYDDEEKEYDLYMDGVRLCFQIKKEIFDGILRNIKYFANKSRRESTEDYDDNEVNIEGFWESIDNMLEK